MSASTGLPADGGINRRIGRWIFDRIPHRTRPRPPSAGPGPGPAATAPNPAAAAATSAPDKGSGRRPVDFEAAYRALPAGVALLTPDLVFAEANPAYLRLAGRSRDQVIGWYIFDAFPDNPDDPHASGIRNLHASLRRVVATGQGDSMAVQRYDVQRPGEPGTWDERYWSVVNAPVRDADGRLAWVLHRVEEVTELMRVRADAAGDPLRALEADLYTRARELQEVNERLRQAHAREREVALVLQAAMLPPANVSVHVLGGHPAAVRYRPAVGVLNVCGDWYDLIDLPDGRTAVAVGDVVGHGLHAAAAMGQLRSALTAAFRIATGPAHALQALGLHAPSVPGGESASAAAVVIDWTRRMLTYSSAGHLPPALVYPDSSVDFLDQATDPPLGAWPEVRPRLEASVPFPEETTLVLYTDGLVERHGEDIDEGLSRLADALAEFRGRPAEALADALLARLVPATGAADDTALVVVCL
jgi:serine phosphatase RsbU (regulator of sigma subunit)/PAS domain-containing protein